MGDRVIQRHVFGTVFAVESAVAALVFLVVLALVAYAVVGRRAGRHGAASRRSDRPVLEKYYVGVLTAFAAFLIAWTAWHNHQEHRPPDRTPVRVDVQGFQWCWKFSHPQSPAKRSVTGTCRGKDLPTLVVPAGRPVQLRLSAKDVIHSLWIPELRYKMDTFPDHVNTFTFTLDHEGRWRGRCAEFCGERHYSMDFWIQAVSPKDYDRYLHGQPIATPAGAAV